MKKRAFSRTILFTAAFAVVLLVAFLRIFHSPLFGHYQVFTTAGKLLWQRQNPYGSDFGTSVGQWFYSPLCGLMIFMPLSFLPQTWGVLIYVGISSAVFLFSYLSLLKILVMNGGARSYYLLAWITLPLVYGAALATKLELLMTGLILLSMKLVIENRNRSAAVILALLTNWKFQTLPAALLFLGLRFREKRKFEPAVFFFVALALFYFLPMLRIAPSDLMYFHEVWRNSLADFVSSSYLNFENLAAFASHTWGVSLSWQAVQFFSVVLGGTLFVILFITQQKPWTALGWGMWFTAILSPLGQNNALILIVPFAIVMVSQYNRQFYLHLFCGLFVAFAYSDLLPRSFNLYFREHSAKSFVLFVWGAWVLAQKHELSDA